MTDITDQDRRDMLEWARIAVASKGSQECEPWVTAAQYVLATVDAPPPTLAEDLARIAENSPVWTIQNVCDELKSAADRAEQVEKERDEARAEVERLTNENENLRRTDNYREFRERFLTVQKDAESNAETPDPADVKPGEAWLVEVDGERRNALKDDYSVVPWNTINADGCSLYEYNGNVTLIARLVPAPRTITDHDGLYRAKRCTVIRDSVGVVCERAPLGDDWFAPGVMIDQTPYIQFPATVLWEPGA